jgi:hypothetical protein
MAFRIVVWLDTRAVTGAVGRDPDGSFGAGSGFLLNCYTEGSYK